MLLTTQELAASTERILPDIQCEFGSPLEVIFRDGAFVVVRLRQSRTEVASVSSGHVHVFGHALVDAPRPQLDGPTDETPEQHLRRVLAAYLVGSVTAVGDLLGDFAVAIWDGRERTLELVRDALGVRPLYKRTSRGRVLVSSDLNALAGGCTLDEEFISECIAGWMPADPTLTPWRECKSVLPGSSETYRDGRLTTRRYWSPEHLTPDRITSLEELCAEFQDTLIRSVRLHLTTGERVWSELSGGLDSSSLACVAALLPRNRDTGAIESTISAQDDLGEGDESAYVHAISALTRIPNVSLWNRWAWRGDGQDPPRTAVPSPSYCFWARDRELIRVVADARGEVLFSGWGPDHYCSGSSHAMSDLVRKGSLIQALRLAASSAVEGRTSAWREMWTRGFRPILEQCTGKVSRTSANVRSLVPLSKWRTFGMEERLPASRAAQTSRGRYEGEMLHIMNSLSVSLNRTESDDRVERRYPLLNRRLAELAFRFALGNRLIARKPKVVLRAAMNGILPPEVQQRQSKGGTDARLYRSLRKEWDGVKRLLTDPILGDLGWVDPEALRRQTEKAKFGMDSGDARLFGILSLETWLSVRSGRWSNSWNVQHSLN